jgi:hypothetical protein
MLTLERSSDISWSKPGKIEASTLDFDQRRLPVAEDGLRYLQNLRLCAGSGFLPADASTVHKLWRSGCNLLSSWCSSLFSSRAIDGRWLGKIRCAGEIGREWLIWVRCRSGERDEGKAKSEGGRHFKEIYVLKVQGTAETLTATAIETQCICAYFQRMRPKPRVRTLPAERMAGVLGQGTKCP